MSYRFWDISASKNGVTLKVVGLCKYRCMLYHFQVIWRWIIVTLKRSLKVIQTGTILKLGCGFILTFILTTAISLTVASKYSVTLKTGLVVVLGHWKRHHSIDHYTTFCWSAIVNIALFDTVFFQLFDVEWHRDLEIWVIGHSKSFKLVPFESFGAVSYSPYIVTIALSWIVSAIKRDIGRKMVIFSYPPCIRRRR